MEAVTKRTSPLRRAPSVAFSALVFCLLAYWILAMAAYFLMPSN
jgi:hypothetical protein